MSFLDNHSLNPHLHLFVLNKAADVESNEHRLVKIGHLAKTRLFDMLLSESKHMQGHNFPTLEKSIIDIM